MWTNTQASQAKKPENFMKPVYNSSIPPNHRQVTSIKVTERYQTFTLEPLLNQWRHTVLTALPQALHGWFPF